MSATLRAPVIPFPHMGVAIDPERLARMVCRFDDVRPSRTQVLYDEDGPVTRFLCRAPRISFTSREEFIAAAAKRYLASIEDRHLAELMYVATLYQAGDHAPITPAELRSRVSREFDGNVPSPWVEQLAPAKIREAALLNVEAGTLEFVAAGLRWWIYGLAEG